MKRYRKRTRERDVVIGDDMFPFRMLASQMLLGAYRDYWKTGRDAEIKQNAGHAKLWINDKKNNRVFSFNWCCKITNQSVAKIRNGMLNNRASKYHNNKINSWD